MNISEIKKYIFENDKIEEILSQIGMHSIKKNGKYISCAFPDGDNVNGCLIYLSEYLNIVSYTREIDGKFKNLDIVDLVNFVCNYNNLHKSINKIKEIIGLNYSIINNNTTIYSGNDIFKKFKKNNTDNNKEPIYDRQILNQYSKRPHIDLWKEYLLPTTLEYFDIKFDIESQRIIFPHFNKENKNEILALVGRTTNPFYKEFKIPKYLTLVGVGYKKTKNLFGLAQNIEYIKNSKQVIIFEGEKSVLKAYQIGYKNCVSVGSHELHTEQIKILLKTGVKEVIIAFDKDVEIEHLIKTYNNIKNYFNVAFIFDKYNFLEDKDAPIDKGKKLFNILYKVRYTIYDLKNIQKGII